MPERKDAKKTLGEEEGVSSVYETGLWYGTGEKSAPRTRREPKTFGNGLGHDTPFGCAPQTSDGDVQVTMRVVAHPRSNDGTMVLLFFTFFDDRKELHSHDNNSRSGSGHR